MAQLRCILQYEQDLTSHDAARENSIGRHGFVVIATPSHPHDTSTCLTPVSRDKRHRDATYSRFLIFPIVSQTQQSVVAKVFPYLVRITRSRDR
jgi:hypothetical protein